MMATATAREFPTQMYIDGKWSDAGDGATLAVLNPADESTIAEVAFGGRAEADRAIEAAVRALPAWRSASAYDRARVLKQTAELIRARADTIARALTREQGKPLPEAKGEVMHSAGHLRVVCRGGEADLRPDDPAVERGQATLRDQARGRCGGDDHPLELPGRAAESQDRPRAGRWLYGGQPAGRPDSADLDPDLRMPGRGRPSPGRGQPGDGPGPADRRRLLRAPCGEEDQLHRLDGGRQGADPSLGRRRQAAQPGAGGARPLDRLPRRRRGAGRPGRGARQVPQQRPGLHRPVAVLHPRVDLEGVHRGGRRADQEAQDGQWPRRRDPGRPDVRVPGARQDERAGRGRTKPGRQDPHRGGAVRAGSTRGISSSRL